MNNYQLVTILGVLLASAPAVFADDLQTVISKTLQTHPQVQASQQNMLAKQQELKQAQSGYYPSVNLTAGIGREASENPATGFTEETLTRHEMQLELRQNIFQGFATQSEIARQQAFVRSADFALASNKDDIALRVAEAYINVLRHREIMALAQNSVKNHEVIYSKIEKRSSSGVGEKSELTHADGRLALARSNTITARANLDEAAITYITIVGDTPTDNMSSPENQTVANSLEDAIQYAKGNNPAIAEADAYVEAAMQGRKLSNSEFYPTVDVVLSGSRNENLDGINGDDDDQLIMLQFRYNLYNGGSDAARKQQASYELARAKYLRDNTYRKIEEKIRSAWNELASRDLQLVNLKHHVDASIKTRDVYDNQYRIGKRSLLDLLNTENELLNARISYTNAIHDRITAQHKLLAYMGKLTGN